MPARRPRAPVKAPASCPKSSASARPSGIAPQASLVKGPLAREEAAWIARATSSLPVPVSPRIKIVKSRLAARSIWSATRRMAGLAPMIWSFKSIELSVHPNSGEGLGPGKAEEAASVSAPGHLAGVQRPLLQAGCRRAIEASTLTNARVVARGVFSQAFQDPDLDRDSFRDISQMGNICPLRPT